MASISNVCYTIIAPLLLRWIVNGGVVPAAVGARVL
jgi:hypothetical protein